MVMQNKIIFEKILGDICYEELKVKKICFYTIILNLILSIAFISHTYKNGIGFIITLIIVQFFIVKYIIKYKKTRLQELDYSKQLFINENAEIKEEIKTGEFNSQKEYILMKSYFIDLSRKNIVKFADIKSIKLKFFAITTIPSFFEKNKSGQFILVNTKDNHKINILNWSFNRPFAEDSSVYDIFVEKTKK